jgi:spore coat polysaccharide biosynthesis protein SpsF
MNNTVVVVQARMGSTRLPGKVLRPLAGRPLLLHVVERVRYAHSISALVVATTDLPADAPVRALCAEHDIPFFAGSEHDVLDRYYRAARNAGADEVVRITADCPVVDPEVIDAVVALRRDHGVDYAASAAGSAAGLTEGGAFPEGLSVECFTFEALERAERESRDVFEREHVTPYILQSGLFSVDVLPFAGDRGDLRLTVDYEADLALITHLYDALYIADRPFSLSEAIEYLDAHEGVARLNRAHVTASRGRTSTSSKRAA